MSLVYELSAAGDPPISRQQVKDWLKIATTADDVLISGLIETAVVFGENYTGREFRANTWTLKLDCFTTRIELRRDPVASITSIGYDDSAGDAQTVSSADYYLKKDVQLSEILLVPDSEWPTDVSEAEQFITVTFVTEAYRSDENIRDAMLRHIAHLYENRGDCSTEDAAKASGAAIIYDQFRIARI